MRTLKKWSLVLVVGLGLSQTLHAQFVVTDPGLTALLASYKTSELAQWAKQLQDMATQIEQGIETIQIIDKQLEVMGDPLEIANLIKLRGLLERLQKIDGELSIEDILALVDGMKSIADTDNGLYKEIPMKTADGEAVQYDADRYKQYGAIEQSRNNARNVATTVKTRTDQIRHELGELSQQLKGAATDAEAQKVLGQIQALTAELSIHQLDYQRAQGTLENQHLQNENQTAKEETAASERSTVERRRALKDIGKIFTPRTLTFRNKGRFIFKEEKK